jgi:non-specific serine/threonine protein kinase
MGVVYRARDEKLDRLVALKFLASSLTMDDREARARFVHEARAAAAIDHPNICTVHEIGETDDQRVYIVMPLYVGQSLAEVIGRGPMRLEDAAPIARQAAAGLAAAHRLGILHRDVKPANIFITDQGLVKVLDFGLAKLRTSDDLTRDGVVHGTLAYMSPEQIRGEELDGRTDIWSLGVVVYEMLTGRRPFTAKQAHEQMYSVLHRETGSIRRLRPELPDGLDRALRRALAKSKIHRFATMEEFAAQFEPGDASRSPTLPATRMTGRLRQAPQENSVLVLPFRDLSPARDSEFFSDGLTEEIITDLSRLRALRVISRTSAMMLKGSDKDIPALGRELQVSYVLEGSVRRAGDKLRITAQLIDVATDSQLWAEKYQGTLEDVFEIQERVSRSIVEALEVKLTTSEHLRMASHAIDDPRAYESYLRARHEVMQWTGEALDRAEKHLENALEIMGENPQLYAALGYVYWQYVNAGLSPQDDLAKVEACTKKVFELAPESAHGHRLLGLIHVSRSRPQEAVRHLKRTLSIEPNDADALTWLTVIYGYVGKLAAAWPLAERLAEIDPLNPIVHGMPGWLHFVEGRFAAAVDSYRKMSGMDPHNPAARWFLAKALAYDGRRDEAYEVIDRLERDCPGNLITWMCSFFKHALRGERAKAREVAASELGERARQDLSYSWFVAVCHALDGDHDQALDWLDNAVARGFINYSFLSRLDPFLAALRGTKRFEELMARVEFEWERFEA